jgi:hypothetical protein
MRELVADLLNRYLNNEIDVSEFIHEFEKVRRDETEKLSALFEVEAAQQETAANYQKKPEPCINGPDGIWIIGARPSAWTPPIEKQTYPF